MLRLIRQPSLVLLLAFCCLISCRASNSGFVGVDGTNFTLNSKPFHYGGTNCYYLMVFAADAELRPYVDEVLTEAAEMGLTVVRTWAFNDGASQWNALQTAPGVYDENIFRGLDYVLYKADQLGIRLILPFVNNWDDYGGMNQYVAWAGQSGHDKFYTNADCKTWYKNHIYAVLNRVNTYNGRVYKEDPTVFAWELGNEPRASSSGVAVMNAWVQEMGLYVKSLDSNHLLAVGIEGFYAGSGKNPISWMNNQGTDFISTQQHSSIDFAVSHSWPDWWGTSQTQTMNYVQQQISDAHNILNKPYVLEEFGKKRPIETRDDWYTKFMDIVYNNQAGGWNFWILYHDDYEDYDGFGVYYPADTSTVAILGDQAAKMRNLIPRTVSGSVAIQTLSPSAYSFERSVTLTATDESGASLANWVIPVTFINNGSRRTGSGSYTLDDVPIEAVRLSAKSSHCLRVRTNISYDASFHAPIDFLLPGGDLDGDNVVNVRDLTLLRAYWGTANAVADINGDGFVQTLDYTLLKLRWFSMGDPL